MMAGGHGFDGVERRGLMFVLSSPSGAGKTTMSRLLMKRMPDMQMSVSVTTRPKRPGEVEGRDYRFVDKSHFEAMARNGELLEWATVFDNLYGTPRRPVEEALSAGHDVLFDIDWQGTQQLRERARADVVSVFLLPPSADALGTRLHSRAQDSDEVIQGRMSRASHEMSHWPEYDYVVVNSDLDEAYVKIETILQVERLRRERQLWLSSFVRKLQRQLEK
jgi:guanylate kinase